jgi:single-stranded DNA-specific DHH superfamily exonuclease
MFFYVLLALRAELRTRGLHRRHPAKLDVLLPLVALGTVADVGTGRQQP